MLDRYSSLSQFVRTAERQLALTAVGGGGQVLYEHDDGGGLRTVHLATAAFALPSAGAAAAEVLLQDPVRDTSVVPETDGSACRSLSHTLSHTHCLSLTLSLS